MAATAHHEAGHVVAATAMGIRFKHVTTEATGDATGHVQYLRPMPHSIGQMHKRGMVALAGDAAQRRFNPRSVRQHHASADWQAVADYARACSGSSAQADLLVRLWDVQAREFVQARWSSIERVAGALLELQTLDMRTVHHLFFQRSGGMGNSND